MYNNSLKMVTGRQKFKILVVTLRIALINNFYCFVHLQYGKKGSGGKKYVLLPMLKDLIAFSERVKPDN